MAGGLSLHGAGGAAGPAAAARASALASLLLVPLAGAAMAATALLPGEAGWVAVLALVIALGVPHGALDGEIAAALLRPRFGRAWFAAFAPPYLGLAALVLAAWRWAPGAALPGFLALSVWHFGEEDAGPGGTGAGGAWEILARGGLPVMLPALLHPAATAEVFAAVARAPMPALPGWWIAAAWVWLGLAAAWLALRRPAAAVLAETACLWLAFLVLPPLSAFGLYFVCLHAPRHVRGLVDDPAIAPRIDGVGRAWLLAAPVFALTLALGAALWPLYAPGRPAAEALLALTLQGLSALTLPHVLLGLLAQGRLAQRHFARRAASLTAR